MDKDLLIVTLQSLLDEYKAISSSSEVPKIILTTISESSTINNLSGLIDTSGISLTEQQIIYNHLRKKIESDIGAEFFSVQYNMFSINQSPWLIRIKISAFINKIVSVAEYGHFSLKDCLWVIMEAPDLEQVLRKHLHWLYREKILIELLYALDPNYNNPNDVLPDFKTRNHLTSVKKQPHGRLLLPETKEEQVWFLHPWEMPPVSDYLVDFFSSVCVGKMTTSKMIDFIEKETNGLQLVELEFLLDEALRYTLTKREEIRPNLEEINKRRAEHQSIGKPSPVIKIHEVVVSVESYEILEEDDDDLDQLFPEIYGKLSRLYLLLDWLVDKIRVKNENEMSFNEKHVPDQTLSFKQILFTNEESKCRLYEGLEIFFKGHESTLKCLLEGKSIEHKLFFPTNQNKLVEVFRKFKDKKLIINDMTEISDWLCANFTFKYKNGQFVEIRNLNPKSVWDQLRGARGMPTIKSRIGQFDWLYE